MALLDPLVIPGLYGQAPRLVPCGQALRLVPCGQAPRLVPCGQAPRLVPCGQAPRLVPSLSTRVVHVTVHVRRD